MGKLGILLSCFFYGFLLSGAEKIAAVCFNGINANSAIESPEIEKYGIAVSSYWPDMETVKKILPEEVDINEWLSRNKSIYNPLDDKFAKDLKKAKLLYIGRRTFAVSHIPFQKYPEAVKEFLGRGGVIFLDISSTTSSLTDFLKSVNVANPAANKNFRTGDYSAELWREDADTSIFKIPNDINKEKRLPAYGYWLKHAPDQTAPFRNGTDSGSGAAMIIQKDVLGKGMIIFNQIHCIFNNAKNGGNKRVLENILSYIFKTDITKYKYSVINEQGGPGEPAR